MNNTRGLSGGAGDSGRVSERFTERWFTRVYAAAGRRRGVVLGVLLVLSAAAGLRLATTPFDTSVDSMLPERESIVRSIDFLRSGKLGENVVISLSRDPATTDVATLHAAVEQLAETLEPPLITRVLAGVPVTALESDVDQIVNRLPDVITEAELAALETRLTPEGVETALRRRYRQLLQPQSSYVAALVSRDPLDISADLLREVGTLVGAIGYRVELDAGHFVSPDRTRALVILETATRMTNAPESARLLEYIDERIAALPAGISTDVISGHAHTVENERTLRRDLRLMVLLAGAGFLGLFLFCFRDVRAVAVFAIPTIAVLISMAAVATFTGGLSALVVGIGSVGAGISVDYGIHAYVAVQHGASAREQIGRVARPITLSALTTSSAFAAFLFSSTPGYREMAWFAVPTIVISLCLSLLVLPHWLRAGSVVNADRDQAQRSPSESGAQGQRRRDTAIAVALAGALVLLGIAAAGATFESDLMQLDGAGPDVVAAEKNFRKAWVPPGGEPAMLVIERADYQAALDAGRTAGLRLVEERGNAGIVVTPRLWPSDTQRAENVARWRAFWSDGRAERTRELLATSGAAFGFADAAFVPFVRLIEGPEQGARDATAASDSAGNTAADIAERAPQDEREVFFDRLRERFIVPGGAGWRAVTILPEQAEHRAAARAIAEEDGNGFVVSRAELADALFESVTEDLTWIGSVAVVLVLVAIIGLVRSPTASAIVLLPAIAGCLALVAASTLSGTPLNVANLIAGIVVLGLCIDYGIFMLHGHGALARTTRAAVTLSAASTLIGAGVLVFAHHPALAAIGTTISSGVTTGYAVAVVGVPALARLTRVRNGKQAT